MFRCVPYAESLRDEWDKLALARGSVYHTSGFRRILLDSFGYRCGYHAVLDAGGRVAALVPLVVSRNLALKTAGVALPFVNHLDICAASDEARRAALANVAGLKDKLGLDYLELRLKDDDMAGPGWRSNLDNYTFVLPLAAAEDEVLALSTASNRNHVRKAYRGGLFAASFDPGHLDAFHRVYVKRMKQLGSPAPDSRFFERFFAHLPDNAFLLTVLDRGTGAVAGGMLLVTSPGDGTLYYPYGANLVEYNGKYLNSFMYWEAVRFGIRQGLRQLDLGRSPAGSGTYRYKAQWGARAEQLKYMVYGEGGSGPPDRGRLALFVGLWKVTPAFITDRVGERLIGRLLP